VPVDARSPPFIRVIADVYGPASVRRGHRVTADHGGVRLACAVVVTPNDLGQLAKQGRLNCAGAPATIHKIVPAPTKRGESTRQHRSGRRVGRFFA